MKASRSIEFVASFANPKRVLQMADAGDAFDMLGRASIYVGTDLEKPIATSIWLNGIMDKKLRALVSPTLSFPVFAQERI